ncbi:MAG: AAA family ATPase [Proteobacteria bacterium]|nr:AAA family ATPase [Pseudomonadota bacterium]MBU1648957.1 AAA family ATPase [Pseudomonadota bacterium]MBU1985648.1 AAA family ATPase [Pseudomonadota bacterium]
MYTQYFGLKEKPFSIAPDPRYLYMSALHQEALAHLLYGVSGDGCFILLTGDVGAGKTTVCRCLLEQLPENTDLALILNPKLNSMELLASICDELEIVVTGKKNSVKTYVDHLNRYLLAAHARGRITALLIDEAQNLSVDTLEQLRLLTNLETARQKLLKIILLGQPELKHLLDHEELSQLNQRITSRYHLLPLARQDVAAYVEHRLAVAGGRKRLFSEAAVRRVGELSRGIPRLINVLCDRALLGAYVEEKEQVDLKIVNQAAGEVMGRSDKGAGLRSMLRGISFNGLLLGLLLSVLAILAVSLYYGHWEFVSRTDQGQGTQGLQDVPADKSVFLHQER